MEFAVIDNDPDTPVENGNTCYCSYKLECVFIHYIASANKTARVYSFRIKFYSRSM